MEGLHSPDVNRGRRRRVDDGDSHEDDDRHDETEEIQLNWRGREEEKQDRDDPDNDTGKCDLAEVLSVVPIPLLLGRDVFRMVRSHVGLEALEDKTLATERTR